MTEREQMHSEVASDVISELKKQGLFDRFRKRCLEDLEEKELYKELRGRVLDYVDQYLSNFAWNPSMNKAKLREQLRNRINDHSFINRGVASLSQELVCQPDIERAFYPDIAKLTYTRMGLKWEEPAVDDETCLRADDRLTAGKERRALKRGHSASCSSVVNSPLLKEEAIDVDEAADLNVICPDDMAPPGHEEQQELLNALEEEGGVLNMELESDDEEEALSSPPKANNAAIARPSDLQQPTVPAAAAQSPSTIPEVASSCDEVENDLPSPGGLYPRPNVYPNASPDDAIVGGTAALKSDTPIALTTSDVAHDAEHNSDQTTPMSQQILRDGDRCRMPASECLSTAHTNDSNDGSCRVTAVNNDTRSHSGSRAMVCLVGRVVVSHSHASPMTNSSNGEAGQTLVSTAHSQKGTTTSANAVQSPGHAGSPDTTDKADDNKTGSARMAQNTSTSIERSGGDVVKTPDNSVVSATMDGETPTTIGATGDDDDGLKTCKNNIISARPEECTATAIGTTSDASKTPNTAATAFNDTNCQSHSDRVRRKQSQSPVGVSLTLSTDEESDSEHAAPPDPLTDTCAAVKDAGRVASQAENSPCDDAETCRDETTGEHAVARPACEAATVALSRATAGEQQESVEGDLSEEGIGQSSLAVGVVLVDACPVVPSHSPAKKPRGRPPKNRAAFEGAFFRPAQHSRTPSESSDDSGGQHKTSNAAVVASSPGGAPPAAAPSSSGGPTRAVRVKRQRETHPDYVYY